MLLLRYKSTNKLIVVLKRLLYYKFTVNVMKAVFNEFYVNNIMYSQ